MLGALFVDLQHRHKHFLRDLYTTNLFHPLFAFLLLLQQFALTADITAITLGDNIFTQCGNCFAGDNLITCLLYTSRCV